VLGLHDTVKRHRDAISIAASDTALLASCPSLEIAKTEVEANAAFDCLMSKAGHGAAVRALGECLKQGDRDKCAATHAVVLQALGQVYGKSKLSASFA
jgi:hypothetical protein